MVRYRVAPCPVRIPVCATSRNIIVKALPETASAIADFLRGLNGLLDGDKSSDFGSFRRWFGRGQQYVSFMRK